jgi:hypothetical protein
MTTTFHYEAEEPRYESSYEGADLQLHCQGLVAVAAGPEVGHPQDGCPTWYELSPTNGKRVLAGVGRGCLGAQSATVLAVRESTWAGAMAGLPPAELVESFGGAADSLYALVDPASGHVEIAGAGQGCSALIIDSCRTRQISLAQPGAHAFGSASLELSAGSLLVLMTHDPSCFEPLRAEIELTLGMSVQANGEGLVRLEDCLELRSGALGPSESVVALYFERPSGSSVARRPLTPAPLAGGVVRDAGLFASVVSELSKWSQQSGGRREEHRSEMGSGPRMKYCRSSSKQRAAWKLGPCSVKVLSLGPLDSPLRDPGILHCGVPKITDGSGGAGPREGAGGATRG